jgi:hypothetical protein
LPKQSVSTIARAFRRDHTTVLYARNKLDVAHSGGLLAGPDVVWRELLRGEDEEMVA